MKFFIALRKFSFLEVILNIIIVLPCNLFVEKLQFPCSLEWASAGLGLKPRFSRKSVRAIDKVFSDLDVFNRVLVLKFIHFSLKC